MEQFIWDKKYSVGLKSIDAQHQNFFKIVNKILQLVAKEKINQDQLLDQLEKLGDYALYHFGTEEKYFDQYHYPQKNMHISMHNQFRRNIMKYLSQAQKPQSNFKELLEEIATFAGYWLLQHIIVMDKKYTVFLKGKGVK